MSFDSSYLAVDLDAFDANLDAIAQKAGVPVMAVLKADAYGLGAVYMAQHLQDRCAFFAVANISEALELRAAGIRLPLLILGYTPPEAFPQAIRQGIRPAIFHWEDAVALSEAALQEGITAPFHFALDTGMSRIGFQVTPEDADLCAKIAALPGLYPEGLFSHYATADCADLGRALEQRNRYDRFVSLLKERGVTIPICHLSNSAGIMNFSRQYDMVRAGIIMHGLLPSDEVSAELLKLRPVLSWHSKVIHLKPLAPGRQIGYGGSYTVTQPMQVATIPVGYADGYCRSLSGKFHVLIRGRKAPILGRVCMDQLMVDVTGIPGISVGDPVVLIGTDGEEKITAIDFAEAAGSFHYELLCSFPRRVPRYYMQNGQVVHIHRCLPAE